ncbi:MAG: patatin-like phospholipase family protein [Geminicoccaceae bacterium]|nr:patatin-like phospholipase family protein [Geminicoccaceae bacterium]
MSDPGSADVRRVNLALQGGGAHGAFTWGVLDRLLEEPGLRIDGISGTSAGAMNAAALAQGFVDGKAAGARAALDRFWGRIAEVGAMSPLQRSVLDRLLGSWRMDRSPAYLAFDLFTRMLSPYQFNPLNLNPLRDLLDDAIDFERVRACRDLNLFVSATNVRTGKIRVFTNPELSAGAIMASACLPFLFQAVELDGEAYWDGGYMGNPAIYPLIYGCRSADVIIVQINPLRREDVPKTAYDIMNRVSEISFNSTLMREMRAVHFVTRLIDDGLLDRARYKRMLIHMIEADEALKPLGASSKLNAEPEFLLHLKAIGRRTCDDWLGRNRERIGIESTVDLEATWL